MKMSYWDDSEINGVGGRGQEKREKAVLQSPGVCRQAFPPSLSPLLSHPFFGLASFRAHPKYGNRLFNAENSTETLASQAAP